ncbi:hypothetical protein QLX08_010403 [Tetragonisca angustula]|uniref:Uncharacterized protein n=1 Tax=Tetragonisca angustula TaxID=166442 RepID=A0AAW0ZCD0_9HYME
MMAADSTNLKGTFKHYIRESSKAQEVAVTLLTRRLETAGYDKEREIQHLKARIRELESRIEGKERGRVQKVVGISAGVSKRLSQMNNRDKSSRTLMKSEGLLNINRSTIGSRVDKVRKEILSQSKSGIMRRMEELLDQKLAEVKKEILATYRAEIWEDDMVECGDTHNEIEDRRVRRVNGASLSRTLDTQSYLANETWAKVVGTKERKAERKRATVDATDTKASPK